MNWFLITTAILYFGATAWEAWNHHAGMALACFCWGVANVAIGWR